MHSYIPEQNENEKLEALASHYRAILEIIGEDPSREGLLRTPMRAAKALWQCTRGITAEGCDVVNGAIFEAPGKGMIVVKDIEFYSFCEHHILPFYGKVSIGYLPSDKMIGLSKVARIVEVYARRLQVQERLTEQLARSLTGILEPRGVIVHCQAQHMCMMMRGIEKQSSVTCTTETTGVFETDPSLRREFFDSIS